MVTTPHGVRSLAEAQFDHLEPFTNDDAAVHSAAALEALAAAMLSPPDPPKDGPDDEENPFVPTGYTYLGQFVDHDLTFDTVSRFDVPSSFRHAADMRTPRFDLDCVYGRGPADQPYLYSEEGKLLLGDDLDNGVPDVMRNRPGRAIIGDPRNDENSIVTQLQSVFIRFHNRMVNRALEGDGTPVLKGDAAFEWARRRVQHHYQRLLLDDYLPRIVDVDCATVRPIYDALRRGEKPPLRLYDLNRDAYMPVEFSAAAYRFGHSMIRPGYRLAREADRGETKLFAIFQGERDGLRGFQRLARNRGIEWDLFFTPDLPAGQALSKQQADANNAKGLGRTQFAYKIDTMLVNPIGHLPDDIAPDKHALALRNLLRGVGFKLPSGQGVARKIRATVVPEDKLSVRVNNEFGDRKELQKISQEFANNAPLWFYVLAEAEQAVLQGVHDGKEPIDLGTRLGEVGGAIVVETFVGLMLADPDSVLNIGAGGFKSVNNAATFSMPELLKDIGAL